MSKPGSRRLWWTWRESNPRLEHQEGTSSEQIRKVGALTVSVSITVADP